MAGPSAIRAGRAFVELFADDSMLIRALRRAEAKVVRFGENIKAIGRRLATLGMAAGVPFAASMKVFASFDDQMRAVKAVTGATGKEFEDLTKKAKFLGRTTSFTASQVASAMLELGRAGFDSKEIDEAIPSVLNLARATGTELATSAEICANTLRSFELPASEMVRVSDVMVAAANNSAQTLEDLGESMSYCAPIASEYGLSLESTAKSLGALANYGIKGSQAGTTLRRVLTNLADPKIQKKLQGIGVAVVDQNTGKMREVSDVLRDVGAATQSMPKDQKLGFFKQLFGLYAIAGGAKLTVAQFDKLNEAVDNAAGTGARAAKEMDAGIGGSLRMMWSAIEGVAIAVGEALAPSLQKMTDWFTAATSGMVDYLTKNKQIVVQAAKIVSAVTGIGIGLFTLGAAFIGVGKTIGIVATMIATVAKIGLMGFSILSGAISAVTMTVGTVVSAFSGVAGMIGVVFGGVATAVGTALSVLATVGAAVFGMIGAVIAAAFSPLGLVIITLGAVAGACLLVYRNASAIGNVISTVFSGIAGVVKNATASVYGFLNRFTEFKIIFGTINIVRGELGLLGKTILWIGNSIVKPTFSVIFGVFRQLAGVVVTVAKTIGSALIAGFGKILGVVSSVLRGVVSIVATVAGKAVSIVGSVFSGIASLVGRVLSPVLNIIGTVFSGILKFISPIGTALKTVAGWIVSFARSFFVVESSIQVFSLLSTATRGAASLFSTMAGTAISAIFSIASAVPGVVSSVVRFFFTLPGQILNVFSQIPRIVGGAFSTAVGVVKTVVSGIGNVFSGIATFASNIFSGLVSVFSTVFNTLGSIVSGFGNFFLGAFTNVGVAVDWLREQFGNLLSFASETVGAIAAALGRGDIEAAIGVVWATIKLIWTQGTTSLVSTWHWLTETFESYGEKMTEGRKSAAHERFFRIKSDSANAALTRLENYIRSTAQTSGRLHIGDISVDESQSGDGFYTGHVVYGNPDTFGNRDKLNGIVPAYGSRYSATKTSGSREHVFELRGYNSVQQAWHALNNSYGNDEYVESIDVEEDSGGASKLFIGRVRYVAEMLENEFPRSVSFEVSGSQTKMTCSIATRGGWAANGNSPRNYGGLIGVTNDGVEGVDIDTAVSTFCETAYFYPWFLTSSYVAFLSRAYGCVNSSPFRGFDVGEVRFLGATGSYKQDDKAAEMTFKFAVSPNAQNIQVGDMTIPFKYGWDYLWVRWADLKRGNVTVKVPIEAYVEKVYQGLNFYSLGIG